MKPEPPKNTVSKPDDSKFRNMTPEQVKAWRSRMGLDTEAQVAPVTERGKQIPNLLRGLVAHVNPQERRHHPWRDMGQLDAIIHLDLIKTKMAEPLTVSDDLRRSVTDSKP